MPKFHFEVTARGTITVEADSHEEAALDLYNNYGEGEILSGVENGAGWAYVEVDYEG